MACLSWLLQRIGSNLVAGASAKVPGSGEQPSETQAPGAEHVEHTSWGARRPGKVKAAPRLECHVVDLFFAGHGCDDRSVDHKVPERGPAALVLGVVVFRHAGLFPRKSFQLGLDA